MSPLHFVAIYNTAGLALLTALAVLLRRAPLTQSSLVFLSTGTNRTHFYEPIEMTWLAFSPVVRWVTFCLRALKFFAEKKQENK